MELDSYEINMDTLLIIPIEKGKSKVREVDGELIVKMSPLSIIKNSCLYFGSTYEGRSMAIKEILGIDMKIPILIEESRNMLFFPTTSCINRNAIWVSFQNLLKYSKFNEFSTVLFFRQGNSVKVDIKYNLIDNQVIRCIKLENLLNKRKNFLKNECILFEEE